MLLIFPIIILIILFFGCSISGRDSFNERALDLSQAKAMQAVAALMIILHHMVQTITEYGDKDRGPVTEWNSFGILFTAIFFFFSGYGLYKSYKGKEEYLKGFLGKRLPKLLIPFLVTNIIYLFTGSYGRVAALRHVFTSLLGVTLINTNAWFLVELIVLYIAFYFCFSKAKTEEKAMGCMTGFTAALVILSLLLCHDRTEMNGHWFMGEWWYNTTIIFALGMYAAKYEDRIFAFCKSKYKLLLTLSVVWLAIVYFVEEYVLDTWGYYQEWEHHPGYPEKCISLISQIVVCTAFVFVLLLINLKVKYKNRLLTFLGGISLEIYLVHDIFRQSLYKEDKMPFAQYFVFVYALSILAAWLLSYVDKFLVDYYESNRGEFLSLKGLKLDENASFEAKIRIKKQKAIIAGIKVFYLIIVFGMLVTEGIFAVEYIKGNSTTVRSEAEAIGDAKVGDRVYFGSWRLDYLAGRMEPIPWIVCAREGDHVLLVSEYILGNMAYHDHHSETDWKASKLCRDLNHDFFMAAFTDEEKKLLCGRQEASAGWNLNEKDAFTYFINEEGKYDFEDVVVKNELVFVLNYEELLQYMPEDADRMAYASKAAKDQGIGTVNTEYRGCYWMEDAGKNELTAMYVDDRGRIIEEGKVINNAGVGVRPAVWVNF